LIRVKAPAVEAILGFLASGPEGPRGARPDVTRRVGVVDIRADIHDLDVFGGDLADNVKIDAHDTVSDPEGRLKLVAASAGYHGEGEDEEKLPRPAPHY